MRNKRTNLFIISIFVTDDNYLTSTCIFETRTDFISKPQVTITSFALLKPPGRICFQIVAVDLPLIHLLFLDTRKLNEGT